MFNWKYFSCLLLLDECGKATLDLHKSGFGGDGLNGAVSWFVSNLLKENYNLSEKATLNDSDMPLKIGEYQRIDHPLLKALPEFVEIGIGLSRYNSVAIVSDCISTNTANEFFLGILSSLLRKDKENESKWIFISPKDGGISFGVFSKLIIKEKQRFSNKVYSDDFEISKLLSDLENDIRENISRPAGTDADSESEKIKKYNLIVSGLSLLNATASNRFEKLLNQSDNGVNIIVFDDSDQIFRKYDFNYKIKIDDTAGTLCVLDNEISFRPCKLEIVSDNEIQDLTAQKKISTLYEDNFSLEFEPFDMYSEKRIEIPFAIENGKPCLFKIGGDAQPHAILSGQTGSGKSVTLHTIIDMVCLHYHPDDVEVWAIDYKAVEFGCYATNRTPNIRIIGQDNSTEFSLSLIDLAYDEYSTRKKLFDEKGVKNIEQYREKCGKYSMPRILIVIDEFHNLVQAIQNHMDSSYKTRLENLLKETRAMGISFVFSSQAVSSGLSGLTESGRDQIGIRLCMKQLKDPEVAETLAIKTTEHDIIDKVLDFKKGQCMYKSSENGKQLIRNIFIIYINDEIRNRMIECANKKLDGNYNPKNEIIFKSKERYGISEKKDHTLNKFIQNPELDSYSDEFIIYPAAPASLKSEYTISLSENSSNNLIVVSNDDNMRESVVMMSVCSLLTCNDVEIRLNILDENNKKSKSLYELMRKIDTDNFFINRGFEKVSENIRGFEKIKRGKRPIVNIWYGLNKLMSEIFQSKDSENDYDNELSVEIDDKAAEFSPLDFLDSVLNSAQKKRTGDIGLNKKSPTQASDYSFDDYARILKNLFEFGPDNGYFNIVIYNSPKNFSKDSFLKLTDFDFRIGTQMSLDDSYILFGTQSFAGGADENTAVCYTGSKSPSMIRPYVLEDAWIQKYLNSVKKGRAEAQCLPNVYGN